LEVLSKWFFAKYFNIPTDKEIFRLGRNFIDYWEDKEKGIVKRREYGQPLARMNPWAGFLAEPEKGATDTASTNNKDTMLNYGAGGGSSNLNYGAATTTNVYWSSSNYAMRTIMEWTLSSGSGTISKISLFLYVNANGSCTTVNLHELTQAFIEGAGTGQAVAGATWNDYNAGSWATPGGDYSPTVVDSLTPQAATNWDEYVLLGAGATNPISGLTWGNTVDLLLKLNSESGGTVYVQYNTKEAVANKPYIEITYSAAGIPRYGFINFQDPAIV